jgi:hypothetical protein
MYLDLISYRSAIASNDSAVRSIKSSSFIIFMSMLIIGNISSANFYGFYRTKGSKFAVDRAAIRYILFAFNSSNDVR